MASFEVDEMEARFGARIRQVRIAQDISQAELARQANVSRTAIGNLESGAGSSLATVVKVLRALGRSDWLLTLEAPAEAFNPLDLLHRRPAARHPARSRVSRRAAASAEPSAP